MYYRRIHNNNRKHNILFMEKSRVILAIVCVAIGVALFSIKGCNKPCEDIKVDTVYIERDSILHKVDSLNNVVDSLGKIKKGIRIKRDIKYLTKTDTFEVFKRDSSLVLEIYKRDTIIAVSDSMIKSQAISIDALTKLDSLNHLESYRLKSELALKDKHHIEVVDSLNRKLNIVKLKFFGYGVATGAAIRSVLPK